MEHQLNLSPTKLNGVLIADTNFRSDARGAFARLFCKNELAATLRGREIVQVNFSVTKSCGAVRGVHFQHPPYSEMKFVRCIKGRIWDVVVDLRRNSPTFMKWHAEELSQDNARMIIIPEGCAHGFQTLESNTRILYFHDQVYSGDHEAGYSIFSESLSIEFDIPVKLISNRDRDFPLFKG